jgi:hypothetical protein
LKQLEDFEKHHDPSIESLGDFQSTGQDKEEIKEMIKR